MLGYQICKGQYGCLGEFGGVSVSRLLMLKLTIRLAQHAKPCQQLMIEISCSHRRKRVKKKKTNAIHK